MEAQEAAPLKSHAPVELLYAVGKSRFGGPGGPGMGRVEGFIEVANIAYRKEVVVHYNVEYPQEDTWRDVHATYLRPAAKGREVWRFEIPEVSYPPRLSARFRFVVRYRVAGKTYWDNNHRRDYRIGTGARTVSATALLGTSTFALTEAHAYGGAGQPTRVMGKILLKDLAYHKQVKVVYSTDRWATAQELDAGYMHPAGDGVEWWGFDMETAETSDIMFAIGYTAAGRTYWDNNFGSDHRLEVPGQL